MPDHPTHGAGLRRYALYQIPGLVIAAGAVLLIHRWTALPGWAAVGLIVAWMLKDAALYPWLRSAYEPDSRRVIDRLVGLTGVAVEPLKPHGYVRVRGELWRAEPVSPADDIDAGHAVTIDGVRGTTLLVRAGAGQPPPATPDAR